MKDANGVIISGSHMRYDNPVVSEKVNPDNSIVKALQEAGGTVEVNGNGVKIIGTMEYNPGRDRLQSGQVGQSVLQTARTKSGLPVNPNNLQPNDIVTIEGVETSVENAQRMGLLGQDLGGNPIEASPAKFKQYHSKPVEAKVVQNESFMDEVGRDMVNVMRKAVGTEHTDSVFYRTMAHLSSETVSGADVDADVQESKAIQTFSRETGASQEQAQKILKATLNQAYTSGVEYLAKEMQTKPEVVAKWLDNDPKSRELAYRSFYTGDRHNLNQMAKSMRYSPKFKAITEEDN